MATVIPFTTRTSNPPAQNSKILASVGMDEIFANIVPVDRSMFWMHTCSSGINTVSRDRICLTCGAREKDEIK